MTVASAKAKLDAQGGDPVTGYISKQDVKDSYDELVTTPSFSGTVTSAGPISVDDTTDSSSGITGSIHTDGGLGVAKALFVGANVLIARSTGAASMILRTTAAASATVFNIDGVVANRLIRFMTSSVTRWQMGASGAAESGANAGSDFYLQANDDAGTSLGSVLVMYRATGKVTVGFPGSGAGVEFGASGPRIMAGTGSPESVVTAPVGSLWLRTDSATTLYVKQTGTGNTGWIAK